MFDKLVTEPVQRSKTEVSTLQRVWCPAVLDVLCLVPLAAHVVSVTTERSLSSQTLTASVLLVGVWTLLFILTTYLQRRVAQPWLAGLFASVSLAEAGLVVWCWTRDDLIHSDFAYFIGASCGVVAFAISISLSLRDPDVDGSGIARPFAQPSSQLRSPEDCFTLWNWMTANWAIPLLNIGTDRRIEAEDVWLLPYEFQHTHLHAAFTQLKGRVITRLIKANWQDLVILSALASLELAGNYANPVLLQQLLHYIQQGSAARRNALAVTVLTFAVRVVVAQSAVFSLWFGRRCYERSRGEMITMLYEKTLNRQIIGEIALEAEQKSEIAQLRDSPLPTSGNEQHPSGTESALNANETTCTLDPEDIDATTLHIFDEQVRSSRTSSGSTTAAPSENTPLIASKSDESVAPPTLKVRLKSWFADTKKSTDMHKRMPTTTGKLLNLMRSDVYEVAQRFWEIQTLFNTPFSLVISITLAWRLIGWSCLVAIGTVLVGQLINIILARVLITWEKRRRAATDKRLQTCGQYIETLRHLRWYGYQAHWMSRVMDSRQQELTLRLITLFLRSIVIFVNQLSIRFLPVIAFYAYTVFAKKELRVEIAFPALQLFAMVQNALVDVPNQIMTLINASIAMGRIQQFMDEPDKPSIHNPDHGAAQELRLEKASFAWPGFETDVLHGLDLNFSSGLTVVYGEVGCGKSALLQAILGELKLTSGILHCPDEVVGYCAQTSWLQSMTIRDNILFFESYDPARYDAVIAICQLQQDFDTFESHDLSPIGENGIGLSGGQKARVALARALYSKARILLLDDPLSALDHDTAELVAKGIWQDAQDNGRVVVLATHRIDLCGKLASQIIELRNGRVASVKDSDADGSGLTKPPSSDKADVSLTPFDTRKSKVPKSNMNSDKKFEEEEHRNHGNIQLHVYWDYIKAGKISWWFFVVLGSILLRLFILAGNWVLKEWGDAYDRPESFWFTAVYAFSAPDEGSQPKRAIWDRFFDRLPNPSDNALPWLQLLALFTLAQCLAELASSWTQLAVQYHAGKELFGRTLRMISGATFRFYDVTPVGRLMNRMTSDMGVVDGSIASELDALSKFGFEWAASLVVVASVTPVFLLISIFVTVGFIVVFRKFLPASQSLRRLEMASLSPLMSNFGSLVHGLVTVRAFKAQSLFQKTVIEVTDNFQKYDHFYWTVQTWLTYRFDLLTAIATFLLTIVAITSNLSAGLTAFLLNAAARFVASTHILCKTYGQMQLDFVSVERVIELLHVEQEAPGSVSVPASWPSSNDDIVYDNVTIRYGPDMPFALHNVSLRLKAGKTTAITGRTGSGKSTLALALFAAVPAPEQGRITIGGIDVNECDKSALRTQITFLAQEPTLFSGSLRDNLDPTASDYTNSECLHALRAIGGTTYDWTLDTKIEAGGQNLSQGQRQLISIARAILRRSSIVIMDEATASIDLETSARLMVLVREQLPGVTLVVVAHRRAVIEAADEVVELARGRVIVRDA